MPKEFETVKSLVSGATKVAGVTKATTILNEEEPDEVFLGAILSEWLGSDTRKTMLTAEEYYAAENPPINETKKILKGTNGANYEVASLSNRKIGHAFLRKLVNQKIAYILSKEFGIQGSGKQSKTALKANEAKVKAFVEILEDEYFTKEFYSMLKNTGKDAVKGGVGWIYVYYDAEGNLRFARIPNHEVYAFWKDTDHTILDAIMRTYIRYYYDKDGNKKEMRKVEYYNANGVWYFKQTDDGLIPDPDAAEPVTAHFEATVKEENKETGEDEDVVKQFLFNRIPFIAVKYNSEEYSLLQFIKELIDAYDKVNSEAVNNIIDIPNSIKVIMGYDGTEKDKYIHNINLLRAIFVRDGGDVKSLTTPLDSAGVQAQLERLRKDIYEFGGGIDANKDTQNIASGVSLKFKYSDLDLDSAIFWNEIASALEQIVWFICQNIIAQGGEDYSNVKIDFIANTDMAINEQEVITNLNNSPMISEKTKLAYHPYVSNVEDELARIEEEKKAAIQAGQYDFNALADAANNAQGGEGGDPNAEGGEDEEPAQE